MLSLYRAWLGPSPCVARPAPPPGAHRPVPRRARAPSPAALAPTPATPPPPSPSSTTSSEVDVERIEAPEPASKTGSTVLDIACCDGPVRFNRVLNAAWQTPGSAAARGWPSRHRRQRATLHFYPCKTCGSKFPSYYFVHKHRKRCHGEDTPINLTAESHPDPGPAEPEPSTSTPTYTWHPPDAQLAS